MTGPRRALVLGCGGVAGGAWAIATLEAVQQRLGWDARDAEYIVGTSVGAVLAALLGAGVPVAQLLACQQGRARAGSACNWDHDVDSGGAYPPRPAASLTAAGLLRRGLRGEVSPLTMLAGLLPRGRFDMAPFRRLVDGVVPAGEWAGRDGIWIVAVDANSGERVAFGRPGAPGAALNDAVCASYGVPGWCPPVAIGGRSYIDGGVASPTSADLLAGSEVEEVILLAPMASRQPDRPRAPLALVERRLRRTMTAIVDAEERLLLARGKRVIRIEPGAEELRAIGFNMMDPARRLDVLQTTLRVAPQRVEAAL